MLANNRKGQCGEAIRATPRSCQYIFDEMYKDSKSELFGKGTALLTVATPLTLRSRKSSLSNAANDFSASETLTYKKPKRMVFAKL